jgi:hypothetical protein
LAKTAEFGDRVLVELEDADDRGFLPFSATQPPRHQDDVSAYARGLSTMKRQAPRSFLVIVSHLVWV